MGKGREITQSNSNHFCLLRTHQPDNVEGKDERQQTNLDEDNTNGLIGYWERKKKSIFFQFHIAYVKTTNVEPLSLTIQTILT